MINLAEIFVKEQIRQWENIIKELGENIDDNDLTDYIWIYKNPFSDSPSSSTLISNLKGILKSLETGGEFSLCAQEYEKLKECIKKTLGNGLGISTTKWKFLQGYRIKTRREGILDLKENSIVIINAIKEKYHFYEEEKTPSLEEIPKEKEVEKIDSFPIFPEKDILIEVYGVAYDIFKRKEPLARFLPPLGKCGEHIRSSGNPKNYGTNLIGIHSVLSSKPVSGNMNIDDLVKYDPNSMPGLINELDKLFEDIINHYQTELRQS